MCSTDTRQKLASSKGVVLLVGESFLAERCAEGGTWHGNLLPAFYLWLRAKMHWMRLTQVAGDFWWECCKLLMSKRFPADNPDETK